MTTHTEKEFLALQADRDCWLDNAKRYDRHRQEAERLLEIERKLNVQLNREVSALTAALDRAQANSPERRREQAVAVGVLVMVFCASVYAIIQLFKLPKP